jgi:hypothetical protein
LHQKHGSKKIPAEFRGHLNIGDAILGKFGRRRINQGENVKIRKRDE